MFAVSSPQRPGGTCEYSARDGRTTITISAPDSTDANSGPAALYYLVGLKYDSNTIPKGVIGTMPSDNTRILEAPTRLRVINATLTTFCDGEEFIIPCMNSGNNWYILIINSSFFYH